MTSNVTQGRWHVILRWIAQDFLRPEK